MCRQHLEETMRAAVATGVLALFVVATPARAQIDSGPPGLYHVTAAERLFLEQQTLGEQLLPLESTAGGQARVAPSDSVAAVVRTQARAWAAALGAHPDSGLELAALGALFGSSGDITSARHYFDQRAGEHHLPAVDRGAALETAVEVFADADDPKRLQLARSYLATLDGLPDSAALEQLMAHRTMGLAYYMVGNDSAAADQFTMAISHWSGVRIEDRIWYLDLLVDYGEVVSGMRNGRSLIDAKAATLPALFTPSRADIQDDSDYVRAGNYWRQQLDETRGLVDHLGEPAPPFIATHWYNAVAPNMVSDSAPGARALNLRDGKIRVLILGKQHCPGCEAARRIIRPMAPQHAGRVEFWYMMFTYGTWGLDPATPDEEAEHVRKQYIDYEHETLPIALWAGPIVSTPDGGHAPKSCVTEDAYPIHAYPTIVVVDGHGIVRSLSVGASSGLALHLQRLLTYLEREQDDQQGQHRQQQSPGAGL